MTHTTQIPRLFGLVLSGGKSTRMGTDKGSIEYHGKPHRRYLYELLGQRCEQTFLSIRREQGEALDPELQTIVDRDEYRGPLNGILSAHALYPDNAWLVLACDLPLINLESLDRLVQARQPQADATALATKASGLPEPLAAIWEPAGLKKAISYMKEAASSCPRKFLIHANTTLVHPERDQLLWNANSVEEYSEAIAKLSKS